MLDASTGHTGGPARAGATVSAAAVRTTFPVLARVVPAWFTGSIGGATLSLRAVTTCATTTVRAALPVGALLLAATPMLTNPPGRAWAAFAPTAVRAALLAVTIRPVRAMELAFSGMQSRRILWQRASTFVNAIQLVSEARIVRILGALLIAQRMPATGK